MSFYVLILRMQHHRKLALNGSICLKAAAESSCNSRCGFFFDSSCAHTAMCSVDDYSNIVCLSGFAHDFCDVGAYSFLKLEAMSQILAILLNPRTFSFGMYATETDISYMRAMWCSQ